MAKTYTEDQTAEHVRQLMRHHEKILLAARTKARKSRRRQVQTSRKANRR